jgi:hypothetical protein
LEHWFRSNFAMAGLASKLRPLARTLHAIRAVDVASLIG